MWIEIPVEKRAPLLGPFERKHHRFLSTEARLFAESLRTESSLCCWAVNAASPWLIAQDGSHFVPNDACASHHTREQTLELRGIF
jgi:hypothetical protein